MRIRLRCMSHRSCMQNSCNCSHLVALLLCIQCLQRNPFLCSSRDCPKRCDPSCRRGSLELRQSQLAAATSAKWSDNRSVDNGLHILSFSFIVLFSISGWSLFSSLLECIYFLVLRHLKVRGRERLR